jgi:hypothetical protein
VEPQIVLDPIPSSSLTKSSTPLEIDQNNTLKKNLKKMDKVKINELNNSFAQTTLDDVLTAVNYSNAETKQALTNLALESAEANEILKTISDHLSELVSVSKNRYLVEDEYDEDDEYDEYDEDDDNHDGQTAACSSTSTKTNITESKAPNKIKIQPNITESKAPNKIKFQPNITESKALIESLNDTELLSCDDEYEYEDVDIFDSRHDPLVRKEWPAPGQKWSEYDLKQYFVNYLYNNLPRKYINSNYRTISTESASQTCLNKLRFEMEKKKGHFDF